MNPRNKKEFDGLTSAVAESRRKLGVFREKRKSLIESFCGSEYSDDAEAKDVYLNLIALATNIYVRQCAARAPIARVVTPRMELKPLASEFSLACKEVAIETDLGKVLRRAVTDALFSPMATVKVALEHGKPEQVYGQDVNTTKPFVKLVSFDDYVRDMSSRSAYEPAYEGDVYYLTMEELYASFPDAKKMDLAEDDLGMNDEFGGERAEAISHGFGSGDDNFAKKVAVQDLFLTKEKLLVTYLVNHSEKPLSVIPWDGSSRGPYFSLWFSDVPDNAMPLPPFSLLRNVHDLANSLFRRMAAQAKNKKAVAGFSNEEAAQRFDKAQDGHAVYWDGQKPERIEVGGLDQSTFAFFLQTKDIFSWAAGNLDSLGGLSPMADTAKQDQMLATSASAQLKDMQEATIEFSKNIFREIAWYEWTDPVRSRTLQKQIYDTDIYIPVDWSPDTRRGNFLDFNFTIIPQSMQEDNPGAKINKLNQIMMQMIMPLMPAFEQQGLTIDARQWVSLIADYSNLPELNQILVAQDQLQEGGIEGNPQPTIKPPQTTRTYDRVTRPGATRVGKEAALSQTLMGAGVQDSEKEAMTRGVS